MQSIKKNDYRSINACIDITFISHFICHMLVILLVADVEIRLNDDQFFANTDQIGVLSSKGNKNL